MPTLESDHDDVSPKLGRIKATCPAIGIIGLALSTELCRTSGVGCVCTSASTCSPRLLQTSHKEEKPVRWNSTIP